VGSLFGWTTCPRCGGELERGEGRVTCRVCGSVFYAESAPAITALVRDDEGRILLARRAFEPDAGLWDMPGGFLEAGEHPLDGLRRELEEETGVSADSGEFVGAYVDTYGDEPGAGTVLNLVWTAEIGSGELVPSDDVSELRWFAADELPAEDELAFNWIAPALRDWTSGS
jgi:ADP-ribose pyrophosphatase YjhB (NUDIX family)